MFHRPRVGDVAEIKNLSPRPVLFGGRASGLRCRSAADIRDKAVHLLQHDLWSIMVYVMTCPARDHAPTMRRERLQIFLFAKPNWLRGNRVRCPTHLRTIRILREDENGQVSDAGQSRSLVALPFEFDELTDIGAHESGSAFF